MSGRLRFEVWTLPSTGTFQYKATIPVLEGAAGTVALSEYSNVSINMTAADWEQYGPLILDEDNDVYSLIRVFDGSTVIDEFIAERVEIPKGRPQMRTISGPQLMGEVEKCGVYHPKYPSQARSEEALDWVWGGVNAIHRYNLGDLGNIQEVWHLWFEFGATGSVTLTVDGATTEAIDVDGVTASDIEGSNINNVGLQGLATVNDVTVSGEGTSDNPIVISFVDPPDPDDVTLDDTNLTGNHQLQKETEGGLDPSPFTVSKPVDASSGDPDEHGTYDPGALVPVVGAQFQDTDTDWTMLVNAESRFAGVQLWPVSVIPGETYSDVKTRVNPLDAPGKYTLVIHDQWENEIAAVRDVQLVQGSFQDVELGDLTIPEGVDQIIFRVAVTDENPANIGRFCVNFQTGTQMLRGRPLAAPPEIARTLFKHAQARGTFEWLDVDEKLTDTHDSNNVEFPSKISFTAYFRSNMGHVLENLRHMGNDTDGPYGWRITPKTVPVGVKTHDLEMFVPGPPVDHTATSGGPVILTGAHTPEASIVARIPTFTDMLGHGTGAVYSEGADTNARAAVGRRERMVDVQHLASKDSIDEWINASLVEERRNRKALDAVVLGTDQDVPFVRYRPGDQVWWQFPGYQEKIAKPVARVSWIHGRVARYRVQGSRRLSGGAAMSQAVDRLLREFRPRSGRGAAAPGLVHPERSSTQGAHIHLERAASQTIAEDTDISVTWDTPGFISAENFTVPSLPSDAVTIQQPGYYDIEVDLGFDAALAGAQVWITRTAGGNELHVWPQLNDPGVWTADYPTSLFSGVAKAIPCGSGDVIRVYVRHSTSQTADLVKATFTAELVDRISAAAAGPDFAAGAFVHLNGQSVDVPLPDAVEGDLLIMFVAGGRSGSPPGINDPAGWTLMGDLVDGNTLDDVRLKGWYRVADGSEGGVQMVTLTAGSWVCGGAWRVRSDVDYSTVPPQFAGASQSWTIPSISPATSGRFLSCPVISGADQLNVVWPSGYTPIDNVQESYAVLWAAQREVVASGIVSPGTVSATGDGQSESIAAHVLVKVG